MGLRGRKPRPSLPLELYRCAESIYWKFRFLGQEGGDESESQWREATDEAGSSGKIEWPAALALLLKAKTRAEVHRLASLLFPGQGDPDQGNLWPEIQQETDFPSVHYCLTHYAEDLIAAMEYRLFPRSERPFSNIKRLWFLSRALAAAHLKVKLSTALNMVTAETPEERALRRPRRPRTVRTASSPAPAA
jgi:hypothetical protein